MNIRKNQDIDELLFEVDRSCQVSVNTDTIGLMKLSSQLPAAEKQVLDMIYLGGYTHAEAAEELGLPLGTVKTRLRRAVIALRAFF